MANPGPISTFYGAGGGTLDIYSLKYRNVGPAGAIPVAKPKTINVSNSEAERLLTAAWRSLPMMPEDIRAQVASLLTKKSMLILVGAAAVWGASQFFVVGELFDIAVAGIAWVTVGIDAVKGLKGYYDFYKLAAHAQRDEDIDRAAHAFASATISIISAVGWGRFAKWMGRGVVSAVKAVGVGDTTLQLIRWTRFIEGIKFMIPINKGMLWSKILPAEAEALAEQHGLVTLEMALKKTGFFELYNEEFKAWEKMTEEERTIIGPVTKKIWDMVSRQFVKSLSGTVTGFVHQAKHYKAIYEAAYREMNPGVKMTEEISAQINRADSAIHAAAKQISTKYDPVIVQEVHELSEMLMQNQKITLVTLIDAEKKAGEAFSLRTQPLLKALKMMEERSARMLKDGTSHLSHLGPY